MTRKEELAQLIAEAGKADTIVLTRRELKRVDAAGEHLKDILRQLGESKAPARGTILDPSEDLGHASAWIDAGEVYEELIAQDPPPDFVFCLDPWAGQLHSRMQEAAPQARWILVSDLDRRGDHPEYWENLESWFGSLSWSAIVPRDLWVETLGLHNKPRNLILQNNWGIGDELLLSAVAREIIRAYPETEIWIRSRHGFRFPKYVRRDPPPSDAQIVETIYQNPTLYGPRPHSPFPGHLVQQMLDKVALDTGLRIQAIDVRPELDLPVAQERAPRTVILHTQANPRLSSKDWGLDRWRELAALLRQEDVQLLQVGGRNEPALEGAEDLRGLPVSELPEVFCRASSVVCVVGLLMHLAEATKTPAVVIYGGRETPAIDGYPDQVHLSSEPLPCRGRWGCHLGPDLTCPHHMKCMESITPRLVARQVLSMLETGVCL